MLLSLLGIFLVFFQSKYLHYTNPEKDYSLEINSKAHYLRKPMNHVIGYADVFNVADEQDKLAYTIIVSKAVGTEEVDMKKMLSEEYIDVYQTSCNCSVTGTKKADSKNSSGALYGIQMENPKGVLKGYSYSIPKGKTLYNVTFWTSEQNLKKYETEYVYTVESMKILSK